MENFKININHEYEIKREKKNCTSELIKKYNGIWKYFHPHVKKENLVHRKLHPKYFIGLVTPVTNYIIYTTLYT